MPMSSAYQEARANDPDLALLVAQMPKPRAANRPPLSEFTPEMGMLAYLSDQLQALNNTVIGIASNKQPKFEPFVRPRTLLDRAGVRTERQQHRSVVNEIEEARARKRQRQVGD